MKNLLIMITYLGTGAILLLMLMGLGLAVILPGIEAESRRFFIAFQMVIVIGFGFTLLDWCIYEKPEFWRLEKCTIYFEYLVFSVLIPMMSAYLILCSGEDYKKNNLFHFVFASWLAFFLMLGVTQFTTCFYYVTPQTQFFRGPLHSLLVSPLLLCMVLNLVAVFHRKKKLTRKSFYAFLGYMIPTMIAGIIHMIRENVLVIDMGVSLCSLGMCVIILSDQFEQYLKQQKEIAQQRASIMVLQMRPRFIYNTMTSIYYLCDQDPKRAQQVTMDFITYLRKNFSAIACETTIPFTEELELARVYLAVEQTQFEDCFFVEFDTPHTQFQLPPLTLQPIVENSIKQGLDPEGEPLHIFIQTRQTGSGSLLVVEDDRPGFSLQDKSLVANIKQRLELMCHGSIRISPREGGGTVVKITVP